MIFIPRKKENLPLCPICNINRLSKPEYSKCKSCSLKELHDSKKITLDEKEQRKQSQKEYKAKYFQEHKEEIYARRSKNPTPKEKTKQYMLKYNYDMTIEEFNKMYEEINGRCPICNNETDDFVVDHNHITGSVRGLICRKCNLALGMFDDNINIVDNAISYLRRFENEKACVNSDNN